MSTISDKSKIAALDREMGEFKGVVNTELSYIKASQLRMESKVDTLLSMQRIRVFKFPIKLTLGGIATALMILGYHALPSKVAPKPDIFQEIR